MTKYTAIVSAHIYIHEGEKEIEILSQVDNDDRTDIFCDIDHALLDNIDIGDSDDYYFMALVESEFVRNESWEGVEYDAEHSVKEIKYIEDIKGGK